MVEESMINVTETPPGFDPTNVSSIVNKTNDVPNLGIKTEYILPLFLFSLAGVALFAAIGIVCNSRFNQSKEKSTQTLVEVTIGFASAAASCPPPPPPPPPPPVTP